MKINVCSFELGEIRQFEHVDFNTSVRKAKYLTEKMNTGNNNFCYEIENWKEDEDFLKTFYDFDSFKKALEELTK